MMDVNLMIADNLKMIRKKKRLSLDEVAKITGVSKSMLGQIERGDVNPTISVIWKIVNGLKLSFTSLLERPISNTEIIRNTEIKALVEDDGRFINYPIFPFSEDKRFEIYRIKILPNGALDALAHLEGMEEFITVFAGAVIITVHQEAYSLSTGESIRFKADVAHRYENIGEEVAELSMVIYYAK